MSVIAEVAAESGLAYIAINLLLAGGHHLVWWADTGKVLSRHGPLVARARHIVQVFLVALEILLGTAALACLFGDRLHAYRASLSFVTAGVAALFLGYVRRLEHTGRGVPCGCYFLRSPGDSVPNPIPALALLVMSVCGFIGSHVAGDTIADGAVTRRGLLLGMQLSAVLLVQALGILQMPLVAARPREGT